MQDRHLLMVGGVKNTRSGYVHTRDIHVFNKVNHSWEVKGEIPSAREAPAAVTISDKQILI